MIELSDATYYTEKRAGLLAVRVGELLRSGKAFEDALREATAEIPPDSHGPECGWCSAGEHDHCLVEDCGCLCWWSGQAAVTQPAYPAAVGDGIGPSTY